jgi:ELWxxDGT repeat protein
MRTNVTPYPEDSPFRSTPLIYAILTLVRVLAGLSLAGFAAIGPLLGADTDQAKPSSTGLIRLTAGQGNLPEVGVSASLSVNEDAGQVVNFTFQRTGSTSGSLEVAYTVGGTATPGIDYTGLATAPAVRTIRFEIGESQRMLALTPVADSDPEPWETIVVRLATGSDYRINTPQASAFGRILNDDPWRNPTSLRMIETLPGSAPSRGSPLSGYQPGWLTPAGDRLFFLTHASGNIGGSGVGERELCWTDGLTNYRTGIRQLGATPAAGAISLQVPSSDIRTPLPRLGDSVFFMGYDSRGWNLWRHDGINATLFRDFLPNRLDPGFGGTPAPSGLIAAGGNLFFTAPIVRLVDSNGDGVLDQEVAENRLWRSDGTESGTVPMVLGELATASGSEQFAVGDFLFFRGWTASGVNGLWKWDGTSPGPVLLKTSIDYISDDRQIGVGNRFFWLEGSQLWTSDGSPGGTLLVKDINPGSTAGIGSSWTGFCAIGNTIYFTADDGSSGSELWKSDGTTAGTVRVADITPGPAGSSINELTAVGTTLFFVRGIELWKTDGTAAGTSQVWPVDDGSGEGIGSWHTVGSLKGFGNNLFFWGADVHGYGINGELWKSDGTAAGTVPVTDIWPGSGSSRPEQLTPWGDSLVFIAEDGTNGAELWAVDPAAPTVTLSVTQASVPEDGPANLVFTFTRTGSAARKLAVTYSVGGTATEGTDYTGLPGTGASRTVTINAGNASASLTVDPTADAIEETSETVSLTLVENVRYLVGTTGPVIGTLSNDDQSGFTVTPTSGLTTTEAGGTAAFTVVLTSQPTANVSIGLTSSRSAEGLASQAALLFTPATWNVPQTVTVTGVDDPIADGDQAYAIVTAPAVSTDPGYNGLNAADVQVSNTNNDDPLPVITLAVSPASVPEDGPTNLVFTFTRTGSTTSALNLLVNIGGTAFPSGPFFLTGGDYALSGDVSGVTGTTATITFPAGSATATVTADPTADTIVEADETVVLTLPPGTTYIVGNPNPSPVGNTFASATGTITNDDTLALPVITLAVSPASVPEDGPTNLVFTFTRTGSTAASLSISFSYDGMSVEGVDFTGLPGAGTTVRAAVFAAGASTTTVSIDPSADTDVEPDETVALFVNRGSSYTLGTVTLAVGTIANDDAPAAQPPTMSEATSSGSITPTSAVLGGEVVSDGTLKILERGFLIFPAGTPGELVLGGTDVARVPITGGVGPFSVTTTGLKPGTQYRFRAYATNSAGTRYSPVRTFQTLEGSIPVANGATVSTATDTNLEVVLSGSDPSGKTLSYSILAQPANGKLGPISGNRVTYSPNAGFRGTDRFTFWVNNGVADSASAEVVVAVLDRPALEVSLSNPTQLTLGVRAPLGMRVVLESLLPHADWRPTGQEVTGQGETKPVTVVLPILADEPTRLWRTRTVNPIDPKSKPTPLPKVDVLVGVDASKAITYTINGKLSPDGEIRVLAGGIVNFHSKFGQLTVTLDAVRVRRSKIPFDVEVIGRGRKINIRIPRDAADQDEYKYSVIVDDGKGNVIHHDPPLRIFR